MQWNQWWEMAELDIYSWCLVNLCLRMRVLWSLTRIPAGSCRKYQERTTAPSTVRNKIVRLHNTQLSYWMIVLETIMWAVVAMGIESTVITLFGMQFLQQLSQLPSRPEESHPILFPIASPALLTSFSQTGIGAVQLPWIFQSSAHSNVLPSKGLPLLQATHCRLVSHGRGISTHAPCASAGISFAGFTDLLLVQHD